MDEQRSSIWKNWDILHATLAILGFLSFLFSKNLLPIIFFSGISFLYFIFKNRTVFNEIKPFGGYANWVTIFRLLLLLAIGFFYTDYEHSVIAYIAIFALLLDGIDGFLARRFKTTSDFGAVLDGESDAFFVLLLSVIIFELGYVHAWILWAGILRYVYVLLCYIIWGGVLDEPISYLRKTIAVIIMGALLTPFFLPQQVYFPILMIATIAVTISFIKSFFYQIKNQ